MDERAIQHAWGRLRTFMMVFTVNVSDTLDVISKIPGVYFIETRPGRRVLGRNITFTRAVIIENFIEFSTNDGIIEGKKICLVVKVPTSNDVSNKIYFDAVYDYEPMEEIIPIKVSEGKVSTGIGNSTKACR